MTIPPIKQDFPDCTHSDTYPHGRTEKCIDCGAVWDETLIDWVKEDE